MEQTCSLRVTASSTSLQLAAYTRGTSFEKKRPQTQAQHCEVSNGGAEEGKQDCDFAYKNQLLWSKRLRDEQCWGKTKSASLGGTCVGLFHIVTGSSMGFALGPLPQHCEMRSAVFVMTGAGEILLLWLHHPSRTQFSRSLSCG